MLNLIKLTENKIIFVDACVMIDYLWDKLENADEFELLLQNTKADVLFVPYYQVYEIFYDTEMKIKDKTISNFSCLDVLELFESLKIKITPAINMAISTKAAKIKASGGLSHYDALLIAEVQNTSNAVLLTKDWEFVKKGFENVIFVD